MEPMLDAFTEVVQSLAFRQPHTQIVGNVNGRVATFEELSKPEYWVRHVRQGVRFLDGMRALAAVGATTFVECGPRGVLSGIGPHCIDEDGVFVPTLRREVDEVLAFAEALGRVHTAGHAVSFEAWFAPEQPRRIRLPTYAFQRASHWLGTQETEPTRPGDDAFWNALGAGRVEELGLEPRLRRQLAKLAPGLISWRERHRRLEHVADWRYEIRWEPARLRPDTRLAGRWWVVFAEDRQAEGHRIVRALAAAGVDAHAHRVPTGAIEAHSSDPTVWELDTLPVADGVISLLSLNTEPHAQHAGLTQGLAATLQLIQALQALPPAKLWMLTRGAAGVGNRAKVDDPEASMVWGLGRALGLEAPSRYGGLVDLPDRLGPKALEALLQVLANPVPEDQVAIRPRGTYVRRLSRLAPPATSKGWQPRGAVLVTGSAGAVGTQVCRWLASRGAEQLVLPSLQRSGHAATTWSDIDLPMHQVPCDISDPEALESLVAELEAAGTRISAVVHTAGHSSLRTLAEMSLEELARNAATKAAGAKALHEVFLGKRGEQLDAFVLFSSAAAAWGGAELGAYGAANQYLISLAQHRASHGLPAVAMAFGPFEEGLAHGVGAQQFARLGVRPMPRERVWDALEASLAEARPAVVLADVDWERFAPAFASARPRPLLDGVAEARAAVEAGSEPEAVDQAPWVEALRGQPPEAQYQAMLQQVRRIAAGLVGVDRFEAEGGFLDQGIDSLMAIELRRRLQEAIGRALPATLVYDHPSPAQLAEHLRDRLAVAFGEATLVVTPVAPDRRTRPRPRGHEPDPIAIVGVGLRMPGGVTSLGELWELLETGRDTVREVPNQRWGTDFFDEDPGALGKTYVRHASFLDDIDAFDARFFGMSALEAKHTDPQQRLLLETSWEALERAGIVPDRLSESNTGVYVGIVLGKFAASAASGGPLTLQGADSAFAAGRIAYHLGLQGPAMSVNTDCSSSLVALHLACQGLRNRECDLALVGGVSVQPGPEETVLLSRTRALAPDGRSKTFSAQADGFGRGEGWHRARGAAPGRCQARRPSGARAGGRLGPEPRRRECWDHSAEREQPEEGAPRGPRVGQPRPHRRGLHRVPRHRHRARRPHRGERGGGSVRPAARSRRSDPRRRHQDQRGAHGGRGRAGRRGQGAGEPAARAAPRHPAHPTPQPTHRVAGPGGGGGGRGGGVAPRGGTREARGGERVRALGHQRARDPRGSPRRGATTSRDREPAAPRPAASRAIRALRPKCRGPAGPGRTAGPVPRS